MTVDIIKKQQTLYAIEGELNMQTVPDAAKHMAELISELTPVADNVTFDLAAISRSDSAGVAFLVDVMQLSQAANLTLLFSNLPQQMKDIAGISGLLDILPVQKS